MQCRLLSGSVHPVNRAAAALSTTLPRLPYAYAPARIQGHIRVAAHRSNNRTSVRPFLTSAPGFSSSNTSPSPSSRWAPVARPEPNGDHSANDGADGDKDLTSDINGENKTAGNILRPTYKDALDPDFRPYGSASRRALRGRRKLSYNVRVNAQNPDDEGDGEGPWVTGSDGAAGVSSSGRFIPLSKRDVPEFAQIPAWFYDRNILSPEKLRQDTDKAQISIKQTPTEDNGSTEPIPQSRYSMHHALYAELHAMLSASLRLQPQPGVTDASKAMSNLTLQYPGENGTVFLDRVVRKLALDQDANLLTLNADDIAEIFNHIIAARASNKRSEFNKMSDLSPDETPVMGLPWLGYCVYRPDSNASTESNTNQTEEEEAEDMEDGEAEAGEDAMEVTPGSKSNLPNFLRILPLFKSGNSGTSGMGSGAFSGASFFSPDKNGQDTNPTMSIVISRLIDAARKFDVPKQPTNNEAGSTEAVKPSKHGRNLIIQIQNYDEIAETMEGRLFLTTLERRIHSRRSSGERVVLIPTTSPKISDETLGTGKAYSRNIEQGIHISCWPHERGYRRTAVVLPDMPKTEVDKIFTEDERIRTREINFRHIRSQMIASLPTLAIDDQVLSDPNMGLNDDFLKKLRISDGFWAYRRIHKVVGIALGLYVQRGANAKIESGDIRKALEICEQGDAFKDEWLSARVKSASSSLTSVPIEKMDTEEGRKTALEQAEKQRRLRLKELHKKCNTHEQKLLGGVVDAKSIRTTFSDVHVPVETKDTLRTLTSLSLIRPDAFTYGVLATDKIPGCLLYGPPGTGKTMLAKAVAKQSGATVLEVSGSDVYDMYVGEGEKNVRAIFTLAKKLSPCIVFIDEADAIFGMRTTGTNGGVHRELINQFLREWDGMEDMSAFIMVATNRPFDLDDAVLRRLPRRLLVDLPTEQDRKEILSIHLKDEQLAESVDLADLAKRTPFYSGSDLKNLCVAAALTCVKEEMDLVQGSSDNSAAQPSATSTATVSDGDSSSKSETELKSEASSKYPARRTLKPEHFEKAMEEISASISEDMSSLTAIKKFDEKYGDKRSQRKKTRSWGFAVSEEEKKDSARVRT